MPKRFGLGKQERLKSRKQIETVFSTGKRMAQPPVSVVYLISEGEGIIQIGVTASKRQFKKATDRNRIKRLLRETYRLRKEALIGKAKEYGKDASVFFIYNHKEIVSFSELEVSMEKLLARLAFRITEIHA